MESYDHYTKAVEGFKAAKMIAIAGYSSNPKQPANGIYKRLQDNGYSVVAINPNHDKLDVTAFASLHAAPSKPDTVVIATPPSATESVMDECIALNISPVWIHRSIDNGSFNQAAYEKGIAAGLTVIPGGCPMMFVKPDVFHACMRWIMKTRGKLNMPKLKRGVSAM